MVDRYDHNLILDYVEGELTGAPKAEFEKVLSADPQLRQLVERMAADRAALRGLPPEPAPPGLMDQVNQRLERQMLLEPTEQDASFPIARHRGRLTRLVVYGALAAMLMLAAGLIGHTLWYGLRPRTSTPPTLATAIPPQPDRGGSAEGSRPDPGVALKPGAEAENPQPGLADRVLPRPEAPGPGSPGAPPASVPPAPGIGPGGPEAGPALTAGPPAPPAPAAVMGKGGAAATGVDPNWMPGAAGDNAFAGNLAIARANLRVVVLARDPEAAQRDVERWTIANGVAVVREGVGGQALQAVQANEAPQGQTVEQQLLRQYQMPGQPQQALDARQADDPRTTRVQQAAPTTNARQVTLVINAEQVPQLLTYLNNDSRAVETADVVAAVGAAESVARPESAKGAASATETPRQDASPALAAAARMATPPATAASQPQEQQASSPGVDLLLTPPANAQRRQRTAGEWDRLIQRQLEAQAPQPSPRDPQAQQRRLQAVYALPLEIYETGPAASLDRAGDPPAAGAPAK